MLLAAGASANEGVRNAVIGEKVVSENGIDNSEILGVDLDDFDMSLQIQNVTEDGEYYYVDYVFQTLTIVQNKWQESTKEKTLKVPKNDVVGKDLGLYIAEELGEVADREFAYLRELQESEAAKGQQKSIASVEYTGLIGLTLDLKNKILPGYKAAEDKQEEQPEIFGEFNPRETSQSPLFPEDNLGLGEVILNIPDQYYPDTDSGASDPYADPKFNFGLEVLIQEMGVNEQNSTTTQNSTSTIAGQAQITNATTTESIINASSTDSGVNATSTSAN